MDRVPRPVSTDPSTIASKVVELCDASQKQTEQIADNFTVLLPAGFAPLRTLDLTTAPTAATVAQVLGTFLMDLKNRGANRKASNA